MDDPRYRKQPLPAALNVRKHDRAGGWLDWPRLVIIPALVLTGWFVGNRMHRQPQPPPVTSVVASPVAGLKTKLAEFRVETALAKLDQKRPAEALALLVTALHADPQAADARGLAERILRETTWHFPVLELYHPGPVERIAHAAAPSSLWVGLAGEWPTLVRWNLDALRIESVLFPLQGAVARSLVVDPTGRRLVIERAGILSLCDAQTLKPLRDLGKLPQAATPSSVIVFSADGLLLAHPVVTDELQPSWVWQIRDTASGEILRGSDPVAAEAPQALTAHLGRRGLRVLHADGHLLEIPISPVEPEIVTPAPEPVRLLHACHAEDGETARVLKDRGPHQAPELTVFPEGMPAGASLESMALLERFPWSRHPGIWTGLLRDGAGAPIHIEDGGLVFARENTAPVFTSCAITAVAVKGPLWMIACGDGELALLRRLPLPVANESAEQTDADAASVAALENLSVALAALIHEEARRRIVQVDAAERRRRFKACDFSALRRLFPSLDFHPLITALEDHAARTQPEDAIQPLLDRLARANPAHAMVPAAANLQAALASPDPALIRESLAIAENVPPLVRKLAESRIAWLEDRRGDAMAGWPDDFPDPAQVRLREDWDGWEQVDLRQVLETFHTDMHGELAKLELPADHDAEQRHALLERLTDPETLRAAGRRRLAGACVKAALAFSQIASEAEATLVLASLALTHGGAPEACLRAEARALSQLGDHTKAHDRWILLLTEYPVATHEPADYAEAAYTAFEVADPRQAIEILTTGLQRFPENPDFALRAGWIALLTGNPERAYGFLLAGRQTGYAADQVEHATVLLTIAAAQSGQTDDATALFVELIALNPAWSDPQTIEDLGWPDELKATLRQLTW